MTFKRALTALTLSGLALSGLVAPTAHATTVAGYDIKVDATAKTCTITPLESAVAQTKDYGEAMWPEAKAAADSLGLPWGADNIAKIDKARLEGKKSNHLDVTTPLAALEFVGVFAVTHDASALLKQGAPFLALIPGVPAVTSILQPVLEMVANSLVPNAMLPGVLAANFINPAVDASSPFVPKQGQTFSFDAAKNEAAKYRQEATTPVFANAIRVGLSGEKGKERIASLSAGFKTAWKSYNTDAATALSACTADAATTATTATTATSAPVTASATATSVTVTPPTPEQPQSVVVTTASTSTPTSAPTSVPTSTVAPSTVAPTTDSTAESTTPATTPVATPEAPSVTTSVTTSGVTSVATAGPTSEPTAAPTAGSVPSQAQNPGKQEGSSTTAAIAVPVVLAIITALLAGLPMIKNFLPESIRALIP